jgi:hypothetical protein
MIVPCRSKKMWLMRIRGSPIDPNPSDRYNAQSNIKWQAVGG